MLKAGRLDDVLDDLRQRGGYPEECRKAVAHLADLRDRMRYDECLAEGLPKGRGRERSLTNNLSYTHTLKIA